MLEKFFLLMILQRKDTVNACSECLELSATLRPWVVAGFFNEREMDPWLYVSKHCNYLSCSEATERERVF